jgi:molecular chaperone GrpE
MSDPKNHDDSTVGTVDKGRPGDEAGAAEARVEVAPDGDGGEPATAATAADQEVDILRSELTRTQEQLGEAQREAAEYRDRFLRSRAELETFRRRVSGDVERAREAGLDSAVLAVLSVFDDLGRALQAAETTDDPATIVPGVRAFKESLERNLENLDIRPIGEPGEPFDPNQHEALTAVPLVEGAEAGTIADVFQAGFKRGDRLVRPARVVVYKDPEEG